MRMIDEHRATADPFLLGNGSFEHLSLGYELSAGAVFPWREGTIVLRRRRLYPDVGQWTFCGSAARGSTTITNNPGFSHEPNMGFQYSAAGALGNGFASPFTPSVRVDFDADGELIAPPLPMFPVRLHAQAIVGGRFVVRWEYDPYGQGAWPKDFRVFGGAPGVVNYNTRWWMRSRD